VQAYVDDMVVTSPERDQHVVDLEKLFATIAKYDLKLVCIRGGGRKILRDEEPCHCKGGTTVD